MADHEQLTRLIARRKLQDSLFNIFGILCTLVGIVTLTLLLLDLIIDAFGLLSHYHKNFESVPTNAYTVEPIEKKGKPAGGKLTVTLEGRSFTTKVSERQYKLLQKEKPERITLIGSELTVPLPGKEDVHFELSEDDRKHLTRDVNVVRRTWQVVGTFMT